MGTREQARHKTNVDVVDQKLNAQHFVILSPTQQEIINQAQQSPHFTIRGRAGSGKTLLCIALARAMAARDQDTVLIITSGWYGMAKSDPTMAYIAQQVVTHGGTVIVDEIEEVLKDVNLDYDSFKVKAGVYNFPAMLTALAHSAGQKYGRVVIAVDELRTLNAPEIQVGGRTHYDWTGLGQITDHQVRMVLAFNPESFYPLHLPTVQSFSNVESELRYRSTLSITKMVNMMAVHTDNDACVETQDTPASDVTGSLPCVKDLGKFNPAMVESTLRQIKQEMEDVQNNTDVTLLYDARLSGNMMGKIRDVGAMFSWTVYGVHQFTGAEQETILYVGPGDMEALSRAKLHVYVVLGYEEEGHKDRYDIFRAGFVQAEAQGLVKIGN